MKTANIIPPATCKMSITTPLKITARFLGRAVGLFFTSSRLTYFVRNQIHKIFFRMNLLPSIQQTPEPLPT